MEKSNVRSLIDHRLNVITQSGQPAAAISSPAGAPKPRLLDRVRQAMRARHLSPKTEEAYIGWIKRFIFFHNKRHPAEMGEAEIGRFLSSLACDSRVAASTQNQVDFPGLGLRLAFGCREMSDFSRFGRKLGADFGSTCHVAGVISPNNALQRRARCAAAERGRYADDA